MTTRMLLSSTVLRDIQEESTKAHEKHGIHSMYYEDNDRRFAILAEEVGEVVHEINEMALGNSGRSQFLGRTYDELTQVAAMAATWMQAIIEETDDE